MKPEKTYSTLDIAKKLGIERERLRVWVDRGYIKPSIQKAEGQGTKSLFSHLDIYAIALFRHLVEKVRYPRDEASRFVERWVENAKKRPISAVGLYNLLIFIRDADGEIYATHYSIMGGSYGDASDLNIHTYGAVMLEIQRVTEGREWMDLFVVNFGRIIKEVNAALS
jgi:DNA-binding transcriptional MerR regulator